MEDRASRTSPAPDGDSSSSSGGPQHQSRFSSAPSLSHQAADVYARLLAGAAERESDSESRRQRLADMLPTPPSSPKELLAAPAEDEDHENKVNDDAAEDVYDLLSGYAKLLRLYTESSYGMWLGRGRGFAQEVEGEDEVEKQKKFEVLMETLARVQSRLEAPLRSLLSGESGGMGESWAASLFHLGIKKNRAVLEKRVVPALLQSPDAIEKISAAVAEADRQRRRNRREDFEDREVLLKDDRDDYTVVEVGTKVDVEVDRDTRRTDLSDATLAAVASSSKQEHPLEKRLRRLMFEFEARLERRRSDFFLQRDSDFALRGVSGFHIRDVPQFAMDLTGARGRPGLEDLENLDHDLPRPPDRPRSVTVGDEEDHDHRPRVEVDLSRFRDQDSPGRVVLSVREEVQRLNSKRGDHEQQAEGQHIDGGERPPPTRGPRVPPGAAPVKRHQAHHLQAQRTESLFARGSKNPLQLESESLEVEEVLEGRRVVEDFGVHLQQENFAVTRPGAKRGPLRSASAEVGRHRLDLPPRDRAYRSVPEAAALSGEDEGHDSLQAEVLTDATSATASPRRPKRRRVQQRHSALLDRFDDDGKSPRDFYYIAPAMDLLSRLNKITEESRTVLEAARKGDLVPRRAVGRDSEYEFGYTEDSEKRKQAEAIAAAKAAAYMAAQAAAPGDARRAEAEEAAAARKAATDAVAGGSWAEEGVAEMETGKTGKAAGKIGKAGAVPAPGGKGGPGAPPPTGKGVAAPPAPGGKVSSAPVVGKGGSPPPAPGGKVNSAPVVGKGGSPPPAPGGKVNSAPVIGKGGSPPPAPGGKVNSAPVIGKGGSPPPAPGGKVNSAPVVGKGGSPPPAPGGKVNSAPVIGKGGSPPPAPGGKVNSAPVIGKGGSPPPAPGGKVNSAPVVGKGGSPPPAPGGKVNSAPVIGKGGSPPPAPGGKVNSAPVIGKGGSPPPAPGGKVNSAPVVGKGGSPPPAPGGKVNSAPVVGTGGSPPPAAPAGGKAASSPPIVGGKGNVPTAADYGFLTADVGGDEGYVDDAPATTLVTASAKNGPKGGPPHPGPGAGKGGPPAATPKGKLTTTAPAPAVSSSAKGKGAPAPPGIPSSTGGDPLVTVPSGAGAETVPSVVKGAPPPPAPGGKVSPSVVIPSAAGKAAPTAPGAGKGAAPPPVAPGGKTAPTIPNSGKTAPAAPGTGKTAATVPSSSKGAAPAALPAKGKSPPVPAAVAEGEDVATVPAAPNKTAKGSASAPPVVPAGKSKAASGKPEAAAGYARVPEELAATGEAPMEETTVLPNNKDKDDISDREAQDDAALVAAAIHENFVVNAVSEDVISPTAPVVAVAATPPSKSSKGAAPSGTMKGSFFKGPPIPGSSRQPEGEAGAPRRTNLLWGEDDQTIRGKGPPLPPKGRGNKAPGTSKGARHSSFKGGSHPPVPRKGLKPSWFFPQSGATGGRAPTATISKSDKTGKQPYGTALRAAVTGIRPSTIIPEHDGAVLNNVLNANAQLELQEILLLERTSIRPPSTREQEPELPGRKGPPVPAGAFATSADKGRASKAGPRGTSVNPVSGTGSGTGTGNGGAGATGEAGSTGMMGSALSLDDIAEEGNELMVEEAIGAGDPDEPGEPGAEPPPGAGTTARTDRRLGAFASDTGGSYP